MQGQVEHRAGEQCPLDRIGRRAAVEKLLDVPGFAMSYGSYDAVARRWNGWGYVYPFVELFLGVLFLIDFQPLFTNILTLIVMGVSTVGVVQSLLAKRRFQCACLGTFLKVPLTKITLIEDFGMAILAAALLLLR